MSRYVPLTRDRFGDAGAVKSPDYRFAAHQPVVEVVAQELTQLLPAFSLAFSPRDESGDMSLIAVLGLSPDQNVFVHPDGRWLASYVPAAFRSHPFYLMTAAEGEQRLLGIDSESPLITHSPAVQERFYDGEALGEGVQKVVAFLQQYDQQRQITRQAVLTLQKADVIEPWDMTRRDAEGNAQPVKGLYRIKEQALKNLPAETLKSLARMGALDVAYAQLFSMARLKGLSQLETLQAKWNDRSGALSEEDIPALFGEEEEFTFNFDR